MEYFVFKIIVAAILVLTALPFHELAHGYVAYKLGDPTAKNMGRLTLNPLAHLDPIGSVALVLSTFMGFGFGWAKPVPVNPFYFKDRKKGMAICAFAGPASNVLLALVGMIIYKLLIYFTPANAMAMHLIFRLFLQINISLAVFNLIPIPPLDGSRIASLFLSERTYFQLMQYERYSMFILLAVIYTGILDRPLGMLTAGIWNALDTLTKFIDIIGKMI